MAWEEELFGVLDELEQQAGALYDAERAPEVADRSRSAYAEVTLASRLMATVGADPAPQLDVVGVGLLTGRVRRVATGWCLVAAHDHDWIVPTAAVAAVHGPPPRSVPEVAWPAVARLGLGSALRRLAEAGERCVVHRVDGTRHDGVVRRVGADFVEVVTGAEARVVLVAFSAVAAVQSRAWH